MKVDTSKSHLSYFSAGTHFLSHFGPLFTGLCWLAVCTAQRTSKQLCENTSRNLCPNARQLSQTTLHVVGADSGKGEGEGQRKERVMAGTLNLGGSVMFGMNYFLVLYGSKISCQQKISSFMIVSHYVIKK